MLLVLGDPGDASAAWAADELRRRSGVRVLHVDGPLLTAAARWEHRVGSRGSSVAFALPDEGEVRGEDLVGVLNRLTSAFPPQAVHAPEDDRTYAAQEFFAFFLSWLHALPVPVLNPPAPRGLCGQWRHDAEWSTLAARAGFSTVPFRLSSREAGQEADVPRPAPSLASVQVVAGEVIAAPPGAGIEESCRALSLMAGAPLLAVTLVETEGGWTFAGAHPLPDLRAGGERAIRALAAAFGLRLTEGRDETVEPPSKFAREGTPAAAREGSPA